MLSITTERSPLFAVFAGALCVSALTAGCLEAGAATAEGGVGDAGTHADVSVTPHLDATSGNDVTMPPADASMPMTEAAAEAGVVVPVCMNPGALAGCFTCVDTSCAPSAGAAVSACGTFYTCFQACSCSDMACINACLMTAPMSCTSALGTLNMCQTTTCASACNLTADSGPVPEGGTPPNDASAGSTCKNPSPTQLACAMCDDSKCGSSVSAAKTACPASYNTCVEACDCSDTSCVEGCATSSPSTCLSALEALVSCQSSSCNTPCTVAPTDGGTKDGTAPASIPNCTMPSASEVMQYNTCVTCDTAHCSPQVASALSACPTYYSCFGSTPCSTALEACIPATGACDTAIDALAACQDTNCVGSCPGT